LWNTIGVPLSLSLAAFSLEIGCNAPMAQINSQTIAALVLVYCAWRLTRAFWQDPLNKAKNAHWSAPYSDLWIWWQRFNDRGAGAVHQAHLANGPVIRLGPRELSVCSVEGGIDKIYGFRNSMPKTDWYQLANSYGEEPMVAIKDDDVHRLRRKMLAQPYLKSSLRGNQGWAETQRRLTKSLVAALDKMVVTSTKVDFYDLAFAWSTDAIAEYLFGSSASLDLLSDLTTVLQLREAYEKQRAYQFLPLPCILLHFIGHRPEIRWIRDLQKAAPDGSTSVYRHFSQAMGEDKKHEDHVAPVLVVSREAKVSSEMQDHMIAGIDTSAMGKYQRR
jgi:hypothetical protein